MSQGSGVSTAEVHTSSMTNTFGFFLFSAFLYLSEAGAVLIFSLMKDA